jgi:hypothetical protein
MIESPPPLLPLAFNPPVDVLQSRTCYAADGSVWMQHWVGHDRHHWLEFADGALFNISGDGQTVAARAVGDTPDDTVRHLYANQVWPLAMTLQGRLVCHAGCVRVGDEAIAFFGESGRGKSTLTASFATHGFQFLSDDGIELEQRGTQIFAKPNGASIRLWDDSAEALIDDTTPVAPAISYTSKMRFLAGHSLGHCEETLPLRAMYFLGEGSAVKPTIERLSSVHAIPLLVRHSFALDVFGKDSMSRQFDQLASLAERVPAFTLDYPRDYVGLDGVRDLLVGHGDHQSVSAS